MLSKMLPWDFYSKHPTTIDTKKPGLYAFLITDPYLERIFFDRLPKKDLNLALYSGVDITRDFIEEHFLNLSFFSNTDHIQVINAEGIPAGQLTHLNEDSLDWSERFMILCFTKSSKAFTDFAKGKNVTAIEIEEPKFWEGPKLWQFIQKAKGVNYPPEISRFVLDNLEHHSESFLWAIDTIELNFEKGKINLSELQNLIKKEKWDFFSLADIFQNNPKIFFNTILKKEEFDHEWFRGLFSFMQSHLVKALSPEDIKLKAKLSKYDQGLLDLSEKWSNHQIIASIKFFSELEIMAKSNDQFLLNHLRMKLL